MWQKVSKIALVGLLALSVFSPTLALAKGGHGGGHGGSHGSSHGGSKGGSHGGSKSSKGSHSTSSKSSSKSSKSSSHSTSHSTSHGRSYRASAVGTPVTSWRSLGSQVEITNKSVGVSSSITTSEKVVNTLYPSEKPINALLYRPLYGYRHSSAHYLPVQTEEEEQEDKQKINTAILWILAAIMLPLLAFIGYIALLN